MKCNAAGMFIIFIFSSFTLFAQEFPKDFREIDFGSDILSNSAKFIHLKTYNHNEYKTYMRLNDKKYVGDIPLDSVLYVFHNGKFEHVDLVLNRTSDWIMLMKVFANKYGQPKRLDKTILGDIDYVEWEFEEGTISGFNYSSIKLPRKYWFEIKSKFVKDNSTNPNPKIDYSKDF
jgi:hypothetical protein